MSAVEGSDPPQFQRILVTGNAGSGKSTLARLIAMRLEMPCHSLDGIVWQPGWKKTPAGERDRGVQELITTEAWVIDGVSFLAQSAADAVVFLDVPRRTSFWRVAKRNWKYLFRSRPELPPGCPEILIIPALCRIIWNFPAKVRPDLLKRAKSAGNRQRFYHLKTKGDLAGFLAMLDSGDVKPR
jgi:adenylate kinase family enzyme